MKLWKVYGYKSPENKWYIGQTTGALSGRAGKNGIKYIKKCPIFGQAIKDYGFENMEQNILRICTSQEEADNWEHHFIEQKNSLYPNGYNLQSGGYSHFNQHNITVQEMHITRSGKNNGMFGQHQTEEARRKISESRKGKYAGENSPNFGGHFSEEHRKKISESRKGKYAGENSPVYGRKWFTNGEVNFYGFECPEGYRPGMIKKKAT